MGNEMLEAREKISKIDKEMAALFVKRMECAEIIAGYKSRQGLQIYDAKREEELLQRNLNYVENVDLRPFYKQFMQGTMDVSKRYQHMIVEGTRIAYSGIVGSFASIAVSKIFPDGLAVPCKNFKEAYEKVANGECNLAVLPIENSYAGEVDQVMDLMYDGDLYINGVYGLRVSQNLLGIHDSNLAGIKKVISHPQALNQCEDYINIHEFETEQVVNTAVAAKMVADLKDPTVAAIASKETADIYGLKLLDHDINEDAMNTTKFAVFSQTMETALNASDNSTFIMMFTVKDEAGGLARALNVMSRYGFNMTTLRSRPVKKVQWQYYFYAEVQGNLATNAGKAMIEDLKEHCEAVKVLGSFKETVELA
ncbi:MAG: chorismate mutase [Lachnospiraceae bacterium]|nr:chorismate mutase [Lachnospiraceae bacterium]